MRVLSILIFLVSSSIIAQGTPVIIKPGIGIDNLQLLTSSQEEVKGYQNIDFEQEDGELIARTTGSATFAYTTRFYSESKGIAFTFSTSSGIESKALKNETKKLVGVTLKKIDDACIDIKNGLCLLGLSYDDILKEMGQPKGHKNDYYLEYKDQGINFHFTHKKTINYVEVYVPEKSSSHTSNGN